jgi:2-methylisocitrate lyase-like PEP mutase family enzyme
MVRYRHRMVDSAHAAAFLELHRAGDPLVIPNPYDLGSARILLSLGFQALATTSGGFAATLGRVDGKVSRDEAIAHAAAIAAISPVPVTADLENGFGDSPDDVACTARKALTAGLSGCSIEDYTQRPDSPFYDAAHASERIRAAAEAAHTDESRIVLTARAENFLRGNPDLADTIARLQSYEAAGADVVYAPGLTNIDDIRRVVAECTAPVNVLMLPGGPTLRELADAGVARVSIGSALAYVALQAVVEAAREFREDEIGFWKSSRAGHSMSRQVFAAEPVS